jgi:intracellular septation protein
VKFLVDLAPIILFFVAYQQRDMYFATGVVMVACAIQAVGWRLFSGQFDRNHVLAVVLVLPFGGLTLALRDPMFIKWNGTIELWILTIGLVGSQYIGDRPLIERMLGAGGLDLPDEMWRRLNAIWAIFFFVCGSLNLYVAYNFAEETWVNFRMFGLTGLSIAFVVLNFVWIMRNAPPIEVEDEGEASDDSTTR